LEDRRFIEMYKRKIIYIIIFLIIFAISFVVFINKAFLYSGMPTHHGLTTEIIKLYNLYRDPDLTPRQIELILRGSIDEDLLPRPMFHLYDPVYIRAPYGFFTAKQWAIDSGLQESAITKFASLLFNIFGKGKFEYHGDYSWTANINNYTKNKEEEAWYGLGHILHLIEDMTVPAHSRNDHHVGGDPYEQWAGANNQNQNYDWADYLYGENYFPKHLYTISEAFDDLAEYSNRYFFSKDSILSQDYNWPKIIKEKPEDYKMISQRTYVWGEDEDGNLFRLAGVNTLESAWRESTPYIKKKIIYEIKSDDYNLHRDYWQRLAPKAVIYGAGVIELFLKDAKIESEKLSKQEQRPTFFQRAQSFVNNVFGINSTNPPQVDSEKNLPEPLPQPKPSRFPVAADIIKPIKTPLNVPSETPTNNQEVGNQEERGESKGNQGENQGGDKGTIVSGPITGGDGGLSQSTIDEINQQRLIQQTSEEETPSQSEPPPQPPLPPIPPPLPPPQQHLIINEIQIKENEFIELYNPTDLPIDLASHSFCYFSSNNDWDNPDHHKQFPATASISAGGYYLIGLNGYPEENSNPDADWQSYNSQQLSNSSGSIAIFPFDPITKTASEAQAGAIDAVAWGNVNFVKEGTAFNQELGIDKSMQRKNFQDSNDTNIDFEFQKIPTPTNSNNEERIKGTIIPDNTIISEDTIWTIAGSPYYIETNYNEWPIIEKGATLIIEPGVIVMPQNTNYTFLEIRGTLEAEGTEKDKIIFTSINDSDYGGSGGAQPGDWKNMVFTSTSSNSLFKNVILRYGGRREGLNQIETEMIKIDNSSVEMGNVVVEKSLTRGLHLINSNSTIKNSKFSDSKVGVLIDGLSDASQIENSVFKNNSEFGLQIINKAVPTIKSNQFINNGVAGTNTKYDSQGAIVVYGAYPEFINNQASNNLLNGILIHSESIFDQDVVWQTDLPYVLSANSGDYITIAEGATMTIKSGAVIKARIPNYTMLLVKGTLIARATSGSEIVFTSLKDDAFGGDTNNDGNTTVPSDGDWKKIQFTSTSTGSVLDYVFLYYGTGTPPIIIEAGAGVEIKDTVDFTP